MKGDVSKAKSNIPFLFPRIEKGKFSVVKVHDNNPWRTLGDILKKEGIKKPICFLPPELQLEAVLYKACSEHRIPLTSGSVYNLPATLSLIDIIRHDALISTPTLLKMLIPAYIKKYREQPPFTTVISVRDCKEKCDFTELKRLHKKAKWFDELHPVCSYI